MALLLQLSVTDHVRATTPPVQILVTVLDSVADTVPEPIQLSVQLRSTVLMSGMSTTQATVMSIGPLAMTGASLSSKAKGSLSQSQQVTPTQFSISESESPTVGGVESPSSM